ncbi:uncharacterized protein VTP21DRAFT_7285 [Calcarisporiella thermophila]|uniref:uncharacterized protein n=1 Tax=Calcarisporiella thermophila TaxID=911321 RepID=UPI003742D01F
MGIVWSSMRSRRKSAQLTEKELIEIRALERTFEGAYWRTALGSYSVGIMVLRIFAAEFYNIGFLFVAFGTAMLIISALRRRRSGDLLDPHGNFKTGGNWVLITSIISIITYIILLILLIRL